MNVNAKTKSEVLFQREIFNQDVSFLQMSPLQRLLSAREPCGFDNFSNIPEWAKSHLSDIERDLLSNQNYPRSYLINRARVLTEALSNHLTLSEISQEYIDAVVSLAERLLLSFSNLLVQL